MENDFKDMPASIRIEKAKEQLKEQQEKSRIAELDKRWQDKEKKDIKKAVKEKLITFSVFFTIVILFIIFFGGWLLSYVQQDAYDKAYERGKIEGKISCFFNDNLTINVDEYCLEHFCKNGR